MRAASEMSWSAIERSFTCLDRTALLPISDVPTAPVRICFAPTLFRGSCVTAYDVPPSAMNTAMVAITFA